MSEKPLLNNEGEKKNDVRDVVCISFAQFGTALAFSFINIFLPFYIAVVSPYSDRDTLLWTGAIMGSMGIFLAFTAPVWGSLSHRYGPKRLYMAGVLPQAVLMLVTGFFTDLHALLILRIMLGAFGGVSTAGLIIISVSSSSRNRAFNFGVFQSSLTLGQLIGPPVGSLAVAWLGYQWGFISASSVLFAAAIFCYFLVRDVPPLPAAMKSSMWSSMDKRTMTGWVLCLVGTIHLVFLPSIFPLLFQKFGFDKTGGLKAAGWVVMLYTCTSMMGTYGWSFLSRRIGVKKMINFLLLSATVLSALLVFATDITTFTIVVMLDLGMTAAIMPLTMSMFAIEPKGNIIGFMNAARFVAMAVGPLLATTLLAFSNTSVLFLSISVITVAAYMACRAFIK